MIIGTWSPDFGVMVERVQMFFDYGMKVARRYPEDITIQDRIARASFRRILNNADARKAVSHVACVVFRAAIVNLKNNLKSGRKWEDEVKKFIDFIESEIIPVYTTMPIEPGFAIDKLATEEVE
ncbi:MAG TPA: hypothetical protein EYQ31_05475 [Candidatus Handelsmanbacteria bacterium]|nr:hypothetical protein [Candidatus Handelsmanbacteria bacterium]